MDREAVLTIGAIVLGGGVNNDGSLPEHVVSRLELTAKSHRQYSFIIFSSRYSLNKPPVQDDSGFILTEAATMASEFLSRFDFRGQPFLELSSTDTIGSALNCRALMQNTGVRVDEIFVVTSDWHAERAKYIFDWAFSLDGNGLISPTIRCSEALSVGAVSKERQLRESRSLERFKIEWSHIRSWSEAWLRLLKHHDNYNFNNRSNFRASENYLY